MAADINICALALISCSCVMDNNSILFKLDELNVNIPYWISHMLALW